MANFSIDDYVTVAERVESFYGKYPEGSLQAEMLELSDSRVVVRAYAYRTAEDTRPGIGHSMLQIPGSTPYTRGSELENAETSAVGRAIAMLGFHVKKSIASRDEVASKSDDGRPAATSSGSGPAPSSEGPWRGMTGTGQPPADGHLRETPEGPVFGFTVTPDGGKRLQVLAEGPMATALSVMFAKDVLATVEGKLEMVPWEKDGKKMPPYRRIIASRVATADYVVPAESDNDLDNLPW